MAAERERELLRQIVADPDDLAARAVYADELQRRGDPRGEFIALELAANPRARVLFERHAATWWPLSSRRIATRNGFIDRAAGTARELSAAMPSLVLEPIRHLEVLDHGEVELAGLRPRIVSVRGGVSTHVYSIGSVEVLDLSRTQLARTLPWGKAFPRCRSLSVANNPHVGPYLASMLGAWDARQGLERLDLSRCLLVTENVEAVTNLAFPALRDLRISNNQITGWRAKSVVAAIARMPALERLEILGCDLDPFLDQLENIELVHTPPQTVTIDLVDGKFLLHQIADHQWAVDLDGRRCTLRWQSIARDDRPGERVLHAWQDDEVAPLEALATAVASGATPTLTPTGFQVHLGSHTGYVDSTELFQTELVHFDYQPGGTAIEITLESVSVLDE